MDLQRIEDLFPDWRYDHPRILYALIRSLKPEICVEVGTYRGYAACYMGQALKENAKGRLYCIDDFSEGARNGYDADHWRGNINALQLGGYVTLLEGKSSEVQWPKKVDFAYVDGWHSYTACMDDVIRCVARGAECVCIDDITTTIGPRNVADVLRDRSVFDVVEVLRDCGLAICMKRKDKPQCTFSQELPNHPGMVMAGWTPEQVRAHLAEVSKTTGINYDSFVI